MPPCAWIMDKRRWRLPEGIRSLMSQGTNVGDRAVYLPVVARIQIMRKHKDTKYNLRLTNGGRDQKALSTLRAPRLAGWLEDSTCSPRALGVHHE